MLRFILTISILLSLLPAATSCTSVSMGCYSSEDKFSANANGLPYWEDIIACFPAELIDSERMIDRLITPKRMLRFNPPERIFYDAEGSVIDWDELVAPEKFAGYRILIEYSTTYIPPKGENPLTIHMYYSKPKVDELKAEIIGDKWEKEREEEAKLRKVVNGFALNVPDPKVDRKILAVFNNDLCLVCTLHEDDPEKYYRMFYEFLTMINDRGIVRLTVD